MSDIKTFRDAKAWSLMHVMRMLPSASKQEIQVWISNSASDFSFFNYVVGILFVQAKDFLHKCF